MMTAFPSVTGTHTALDPLLSCGPFTPSRRRTRSHSRVHAHVGTHTFFYHVWRAVRDGVPGMTIRGWIISPTRLVKVKGLLLYVKMFGPRWRKIIHWSPLTKYD